MSAAEDHRDVAEDHRDVAEDVGHDHPKWASRFRKTGETLLWTVEPWRDLPWPSKVMKAGTAAAAALWVVDNFGPFFGLFAQIF